jgi:hypothetical protein
MIACQLSETEILALQQSCPGFICKVHHEPVHSKAMSSAFQIARKREIKNAQRPLTVLRGVADHLSDRASDRSPLGDQCRK